MGFNTKLNFLPICLSLYNFSLSLPVVYFNITYFAFCVAITLSICLVSLCLCLSLCLSLSLSLSLPLYLFLSLSLSPCLKTRFLCVVDPQCALLGRKGFPQKNLELRDQKKRKEKKRNFPPSVRQSNKFITFILQLIFIPSRQLSA